MQAKTHKKYIPITAFNWGGVRGNGWIRIGGSKGGAKLFHFHAVFGKKICKIIPICKLAHPPRENPGSATVLDGSFVFLLDPRWSSFEEGLYFWIKQ